MASKFTLKRKTPKGKGVDAWRNIGKAGGVKVGILKGTGAHTQSKGPSPALISEIAWWQEFGTWNIPPRPFLRPTIRKNRREYSLEMQHLLSDVLFGKTTADVALKGIGLKVESDIKQAITDLKSPGLADSTKAIRKSNSDNPLVDTGEMRRSVASALMRKARA